MRQPTLQRRSSQVIAIFGRLAAQWPAMRRSCLAVASSLTSRDFGTHAQPAVEIALADCLIGLRRREPSDGAESTRLGPTWTRLSIQWIQPCTRRLAPAPRRSFVVGTTACVCLLVGRMLGESTRAPVDPATFRRRSCQPNTSSRVVASGCSQPEHRQQPASEWPLLQRVQPASPRLWALPCE